MNACIRVILKKDHFSPFGTGPFIVIEESPNYFLGMAEHENGFTGCLISDMRVLPKTSYEMLSEGARWEDVTAECQYDGDGWITHRVSPGAVVSILSAPYRHEYRIIKVRHCSPNDGDHRWNQSTWCFRVERKVSQ